MEARPIIRSTPDLLVRKEMSTPIFHHSTLHFTHESLTSHSRVTTPSPPPHHILTCLSLHPLTCLSLHSIHVNRIDIRRRPYLQDSSESQRTVEIIHHPSSFILLIPSHSPPMSASSMKISLDGEAQQSSVA